MNVVFLLLTAASGPGGHPAPAPAPSCSACDSGGCGAVSTACGGDCCDKPSLRDRLKGMFAKKGGDCCEAAPTPCCTQAPAPAPCCGPTSGCCDSDPCASKPSLFDRVKGMFGRKGGDCCQTTTASSCCDGAQQPGAVPYHNPHPAPTPYGAPHAHPAPAPQPAPPVHHNPGPAHAPHAAMPPGPGPAPYAPPVHHQPRYNVQPAPQHHGAPIVNPAQPNGGQIVNQPQPNGGQIIAPAPNQGDSRPLPQGDKPAEPIQRQPNEEKNNNNQGARATPTPVVQPAAAKVETEVKNPFELDRRYGKRVGHAADYSKLTGQLSYVHTDGGLWVLRYASLGAEDANGGSVILARDRQMNNYREGDLVTVEGEVISDRGSSRLGGPLYRVRSIVLVDRPR